jgi:hypothetical protein
MTIVFVGITNCPGYSGDMNGTFCLTLTSPGSHIWSGVGNNFDDGSGPRSTQIDVVCAPGSNEFSIAYYAPDGFPAGFFLVVPEVIPPSLIDIPNGQTNCDDFQATGGTATITCGCA